MRLAKTFQKLNPDVVLVVGDRVEAFAAAAAAHISQIPLAHVHGGDRALGQIDDSLRHAISKLAHIHFPATRESSRRLRRLGEDTFRVFTVGSPGIDGINDDAAPLEECITAIQMSPLRFKEDPRVPLRKHRYALFLFHPVSANDLAEQTQVAEVFAQVADMPYEHVITIDSNTDPGSSGIRQWSAIQWLENPEPTRRIFVDNIPRQAFLGLLRDAAVLVGNSSSGIIEAASFGTPVINIGDRQKGRDRNHNVIDVPANAAAIRRALRKVWNNGRPIRFPKKNIYGSGRTSEKIAQILATIPLDERLRRKLITY